MQDKPLKNSQSKQPPLSETLTSAELRAIARHGVTRAFPNRTIIVSEGDSTDSLYIILSGRVRVFVADEHGKEITLSTQGQGEYFGEMVLDGGPRSASVMTLEATRFLVVTQQDFRSFIARSPEFALHLISKLIRRVRVLTGNVKSLALMDVYGRVARLLLELAQESGGKRVIERCPTQQEMANRVGASREMISRIMKDLSAGGYVIVDRRRVTIARSLPEAW